MGKYDYDRPGKPRKIKNPKFRDHYDDTYSDEDINDFFRRKNKHQKNIKRQRDQETDYDPAP